FGVSTDPISISHGHSMPQSDKSSRLQRDSHSSPGLKSLWFSAKEFIKANHFIDVTNPMIDWVRVNSGYSPLVPILQKLVLSYVRQSSLNYGVKSIPEETMVIHGHFSADKFDYLLPTPIQSVVIGDPWKRMVSLYRQWHKVRGQSNHRVVIPFDENMSFEEFATLPELNNYQTKTLAGKDLTSFAAVGTDTRNIPPSANNSLKLRN
ncbi:MAG: hypothetical protein ABII21_00025, partial [bacterium]